MLITIKALLSPLEVKQFREHLDKAHWQDGQITAGSLSSSVKNNQQIDPESEVAISLGNHILKKLGHHAAFISAALPDKIYPPKFNRYAQGESYGPHIDGSIMMIPNSQQSLRSDLSVTLFLTEPDEYEGGELTIETEFGQQQVKLASGDMIMYPSSSLHHVTPVISGVRTSAFFWIQSMINSTEKRDLLYDLDQSIQTLMKCGSDQKALTQLTGVYHNLIRQWGQV